jgi:hypothetical protein
MVEHDDTVTGPPMLMVEHQLWRVCVLGDEGINELVVAAGPGEALTQGAGIFGADRRIAARVVYPRWVQA